MFRSKLVMTPGFARSLRKSAPTSFPDFLSNFRAMGKGNVDTNDLRKSGIELNKSFNWLLDF